MKKFSELNKQDVELVISSCVKFPYEACFPKNGEYHLLHRFSSENALSFDVVSNKDNKRLFILTVKKGWKIELINAINLSVVYTPENWQKMLLDINLLNLSVL